MVFDSVVSQEIEEEEKGRKRERKIRNEREKEDTEGIRRREKRAREKLVSSMMRFAGRITSLYPFCFFSFSVFSLFPFHLFSPFDSPSPSHYYFFFYLSSWSKLNLGLRASGYLQHEEYFEMHKNYHQQKSIINICIWFEVLTKTLIRVLLFWFAWFCFFIELEENTEIEIFGYCWKIKISKNRNFKCWKFLIK